ncbi:MAG: EF-hand domain-containing protein, partial [Coleofasciculus sp. C2-GNP5-27]
MSKQNAKTMNDAEVEKLWQAFRVFDEDGSGEISAEELSAVMRSLGQNPTDAQLHDMMQDVDVDGSGAIDFEEFKALMVSQQGDRESRLRLAFSVFDEDGSGHICANELKNVMSRFGLTDAELQEMIKEVDRDGDAFIDFEEFCQLVPEDDKSSTGDHDSCVELTEGDRNDEGFDGEGFIDFEEFCPILPEDNQASDGDQESSVAATLHVPSSTPTPEADTTLSTQDLAAEVTKLEEILTQQVKDDCTRKRGTSRLQMQIGLFRLIQGAAYRCFRESFSANHETHLRVRNLPYRISDFTKFV